MTSPKRQQIQLVKLGRTGARIQPLPSGAPKPLSLRLKQQALHSIGITAVLETLADNAFTLSPRVPFKQNRAELNLYGPEIVAAAGWAQFSANVPNSSVDVMFLNVTSERPYLVDLAVISLGGQANFTARPVLDRTGVGQTTTIPAGAGHVLFAVEVTSSNSGIEIICDVDYQFHGCEITPLPAS